MKYRASFIAAGVTLAAVIAGGSILAAALSTPPSPARTSARLRRTRSRTRPQRATHPASIAITASRAIRTISIEAGSASPRTAPRRRTDVGSEWMEGEKGQTGGDSVAGSSFHWKDDPIPVRSRQPQGGPSIPSRFRLVTGCRRWLAPCS